MGFYYVEKLILVLFHSMKQLFEQRADMALNLISVIISTRNRAKQLPKAIEALLQIEYAAPWELIIVDNGSTDDTKAVIKKYLAHQPQRVRYVFEQRPGLSNARNAGLRQAQGDLIAFTDDDCYAEPDFLTQIASAFRDESLGYLTGRIMLYDKSDYPVTINESLVAKLLPAHTYLYPGDVKGANMAFRRNVLDQIEGFDPLFGSGSFFPSEDCDAAARAGYLGWRGEYNPAVVVYHHHGRKQEHLKKLFRDYDIGRGAYHAKLMVTLGKHRHALRGWKGLLRRGLVRPKTIYWELYGATLYILKNRETR